MTHDGMKYTNNIFRRITKALKVKALQISGDHIWLQIYSAPYAMIDYYNDATLADDIMFVKS